MLSTKDPRESVTITFDLAHLAKVISSATVSVSVRTGTDENPMDMLEDTPQISGNNKVLQRFVGGLHGVNYLLTVDATSDSGETFIHTDVLRVRQEPYIG